MKVLINMYHVRPDNLYLSIPLYSWRLVKGMQGDNNIMLLFKSDYASELHSMLPDFDFRVIKIPFDDSLFGYITRPLRAYLFKIKTNAIDCDVFFNGVDIDHLSYLSSKHKRIIVIHDLKALKQYGYLKRRRFYKIYRRSISNADKVIAISNFTKLDILRFYPMVPKDKITVVYNSIPIVEQSNKPANFNISGEYILNVNTLLEHKNPMTLLKSYNLIKDKTDAILLFVGRESHYWKQVMYPYIKENGLSHRVIRYQDLTEQELRFLYEHASLFVSPSLYEGFGYTPIEAAMCGCPVVCSTSEALPDTTQGLLNYYELAIDEEALAEKILAILKNPPTKEDLKSIACTYKDKYSTERQIQEINNVIKSVYNTPRFLYHWYNLKIHLNLPAL